MKRFIAYLDYLGFKDFILKNDEDKIKTRTGHLLRDIELSLGQGNYKQGQSGVILADLENSTVNCLNISDTVIFWTKDDTMESLQDLLKVVYEFNWREVRYTMPVRGIICYESFNMWNGNATNARGAIYSANMMHGKGLVHAHLKAENLNWAGTVIDPAVIEKIAESTDPKKFLEEFAVEYPVPIKNPAGTQDMYALKLCKPLNEEAFKNFSNSTEAAFRGYQEKIENPRAKEMLENTLAFLKTHIE